MKEHVFFSRYGQKRTLTKVGEGSYILEGKTNFLRGAEGMVDFEGGPFILKGMPLCHPEVDSPEFVSVNEYISEVKAVPVSEVAEFLKYDEETFADTNYAWVKITTFLNKKNLSEKSPLDRLAELDEELGLL
jgi:hypothetical protein